MAGRVSCSTTSAQCHAACVICDPLVGGDQFGEAGGGGRFVGESGVAAPPLMMVVYRPRDIHFALSHFVVPRPLKFGGCSLPPCSHASCRCCLYSSGEGAAPSSAPPPQHTLQLLKTRGGGGGGGKGVVACTVGAQLAIASRK